MLEKEKPDGLALQLQASLEVKVSGTQVFSDIVSGFEFKSKTWCGV
jgi:hypothetical protein